MPKRDAVDVGLSILRLVNEVAQEQELEERRQEFQRKQDEFEFAHRLREQFSKTLRLVHDIRRFEQMDMAFAAGCARIVESQFDGTGIGPELFTEPRDREYAAQVVSESRNVSQLLRANLTAEQAVRIDQVAQSLDELTDLQYFLNHQDTYRRFKECDAVVEKYGARQTGAAKYLPGCLVPAAFLTVAFTVVSMVDRELQLAVAIFFALILLGINIAVTRYWNTGGYNRSKEEAQRLLKTFNVGRMVATSKRYGLADAIQQRARQSSQNVLSFLGELQTGIDAAMYPALSEFVGALREQRRRA